MCLIVFSTMSVVPDFNNECVNDYFGQNYDSKKVEFPFKVIISSLSVVVSKFKQLHFRGKVLKINMAV